ncbi:MAG: serine hydrolase domain-containing protein [Pseudohongiellaceae bacterium]
MQAKSQINTRPYGGVTMKGGLSLRICSLIIAMTSGSVANAQDLGFALPESVGMSSAVLDTATSRLRRHIEAGELAGVVAAVARDNKIVYFQSLGLAVIESGRPMTDNALFRVYSMTRQITSTAILMLAEDGLLDVNDPVSKYLPRFDRQQVFLDPVNPDPHQTRESMGNTTIAQLLTHTGGLGPRSAPVYVANQVRDRNITLDEMVENAAGMPLFADPGTEFRYGISATILGKVVEVVSGQALEEFLWDRLLAPVGMVDTVFWADSTRVGRLATVYRSDDGSLYPTELESIPFSMQPRLIEGGVGLLSTVMDYLRFSQMILNGGEIDGRRVLEPSTVERIFANAVPDAVLPLNNRGYWLGSGWSLGGFNVVLDNSEYDFPVSNGTIWWDGSAGTRYFIDREQNLITVIMAQVSPAGGGGFREEFKQLVDGAILQRR